MNRFVIRIFTSLANQRSSKEQVLQGSTLCFICCLTFCNSANWCVLKFPKQIRSIILLTRYGLSALSCKGKCLKVCFCDSWWRLFKDSVTNCCHVTSSTNATGKIMVLDTFLLLQFLFTWKLGSSSLHWLILVLFCVFSYNGVDFLWFIFNRTLEQYLSAHFFSATFLSTEGNFLTLTSVCTKMNKMREK